jgi:chromosome segregation and condensation protein ScpB
MLEKPITKSENKIYGSKAFYRVVRYLVDNNLIQKKRLRDNTAQYTLTIKGNLVARLLAGLKDSDPEMYEKYGLI